MAKKLAIGHIDCHFCGFDSAEVKNSDKSGLAYTFCPDCNAQGFCRTQYQHDKLISKMRPVETLQKIPVEDVEKLKNSILPPVTVTEKKAGFQLGDL